LHTAQWDPEVNLAGKRVAVVGTGASAVQTVPTIAKMAQKVTVFQRTAAWVPSRPNRPVPEQMKALLTTFPWLASV